MKRFSRVAMLDQINRFDNISKWINQFEAGPFSSKGNSDVSDLLSNNVGGVLEISNSAPVEAADLFTIYSDAAVKLRIDSTNESLEPLTVHTQFSQAVDRYDKEPVLAFKEDPTKAGFTYISYVDYYQLCCQAARGFIKLGLQRFESVGILGFNSVEWFLSYIGAIFAGGLSCGIYATNSSEACHYIADHSRAGIIVVENEMQLKKILHIRDRLPKLKAIIQYRGEIKKSDPIVCTWYDFMMMAKDLPNTDLVDRLKSQRPNHCCSLIYTSGTTGDPKGVMISHDNLTFTSRILANKVFTDASVEHSISFLPMSHVAPIMCDIYLPFTRKVVVHFAQPDALKGTLIDTMKEVRPTMFFGVPRVWEKLQEKMKEVGESVTGWKKSLATWAKDIGYRGGLAQMNNESVPCGWALANCLVLSKVKKDLGLDRCAITYAGAAPMTRETLNYFLSLGIKIKEVYGLSETSGPNNLCGFDEYSICSVGTDFDSCKTRIDKPDAENNGEVCMFGRNVFMGYLEAKEKSEEVFDPNGYFRSGDIGKYENKCLFITGRIKELIITAGGENVAPVPIEERILENLPCIANAMLIGDKKKFLSLLIAFRTVINLETQEPTDQLTPAAQRWLQSVGCSITSVGQLIVKKPKAVMAAIQAGVDKTNKQSVSRSQAILKWQLLPREFSLPGGELGPTLKVRRPIVLNMYHGLIEDIYAN